jgi:hypothetical protein
MLAYVAATLLLLGMLTILRLVQESGFWLSHVRSPSSPGRPN